MSYVFAPSPIVGVPVAGSDALFPVRRVYCVGRNYAAHAREMGFDPDREPPFFFCKPADAATKSSWLPPSARPERTFRPSRRWTTCSATPPVWT